MKRFFFGLAILFSICRSFISGAEGLPAVRTLHKLTPAGANYYYHIVKIDTWGGVDPKGEYLAEQLLKYALLFNVREFKKRYPDLDASFFDKMLAKGIQIKRPSSMIIIFRGDDIQDVVATLRFAIPDENGRIPLEDDLKWNYPRTPLSRDWFADYDFMEGKIRQIHFSGKRLVGDPIEVKNFVVSEGLAEDLVPILYFSAEYAHLSGYGRSIPVTKIPKDVLLQWHPLPDPNLQFPFKILTQKDRALRYQKEFGFKITESGPNAYDVEGKVPSMGVYTESYDPLEPPTMDVSASEYVLECDKRMVPYYRKLGFELVQDKPVLGDNYVMKISRLGYLKVGLDHFKKRPGFAIWENRGIQTWVSTDKFYERHKEIELQRSSESACNKIFDARPL